VLENIRVHDQTAGISDLLTSVVLVSRSQAEQESMCHVCSATSWTGPTATSERRNILISIRNCCNEREVAGNAFSITKPFYYGVPHSPGFDAAPRRVFCQQSRAHRHHGTAFFASLWRHRWAIQRKTTMKSCCLQRPESYAQLWWRQSKNSCLPIAANQDVTSSAKQLQ